jgi:hypothetical protein
MSWNGADLYVRAVDPQDGPDLPAGLTRTGRTGTFERFPVAASVAGGWLHVHFAAGAVDAVPDDAGRVAARGRVVVARYVGVADTWTLEVAEDGVPVRVLVLSEGEAVVDEGEALPEEDDELEDPEEWLFRVLDRLTGRAVDRLPLDEPVWSELT